MSDDVVFGKPEDSSEGDLTETEKRADEEAEASRQTTKKRRAAPKKAAPKAAAPPAKKQIDRSKYVPTSQIGVDDEKFTIIVDEGDESEPNYVFVSLNGKAWQLQRGVEIPDVPQCVLDVLDHAIGTRLVRQVNPETNQTVESSRNYQRYPYRVVRNQ